MVIHFEAEEEEQKESEGFPHLPFIQMRGTEGEREGGIEQENHLH